MTELTYPRDYSLTGPRYRTMPRNTTWSPPSGIRRRSRRKRLKELMQRSNGPAIRDTADLVRRLRRSPAASPSGSGRPCGRSPSSSPMACSMARLSDSRWHECSHGTAFKTPWMNDVIYHHRLLHDHARAHRLALEPHAPPHRHADRRPRSRNRRHAPHRGAEGHFDVLRHAPGLGRDQEHAVAMPRATSPRMKRPTFPKASAPGSI